MVNDRASRGGEDDPYEADSDHEYESLEADRGVEARIAQQAERFASIDANDFSSTDDENVESASPGRTQDRERLEDLDDALDETAWRDPEALAVDEARRHAIEPGEPRQPTADFMDRTPLTEEQIDFDEIVDEA